MIYAFKLERREVLLCEIYKKGLLKQVNLLSSIVINKMKIVTISSLLTIHKNF